MNTELPEDVKLVFLNENRVRGEQSNSAFILTASQGGSSLDHEMSTVSTSCGSTVHVYELTHWEMLRREMEIKSLQFKIKHHVEANVLEM